MPSKSTPPKPTTHMKTANVGNPSRSVHMETGPVLATVVESEPVVDPEYLESHATVIPKEINLENYLKLYEEMLKYKTEAITAKKRLMEYEVQQIQKAKYNPNAIDMKDKLINILLESDLNIDAIPDDVERQIYRIILDFLDTGISTASKCCVLM